MTDATDVLVLALHQVRQALDWDRHLDAVRAGKARAFAHGLLLGAALVSASDEALCNRLALCGAAAAAPVGTRVEATS